MRLQEACVCLYTMCVVPPASLSEECLWVRWSRSVNCCTCSPPLAGSQRMMGNWAMFSEENQIIRLWSSRRLFLESDSHISHSRRSQSGPKLHKRRPWQRTTCQPSFSSKGWSGKQIDTFISGSLSHHLSHSRDSSFPIA